jgi:hypothetical protein
MEHPAIAKVFDAGSTLQGTPYFVMEYVAGVPITAYCDRHRPDDWQRFRATSLLGASLAGQNKYAEAEPLLLDGYQGMAVRKDRMGVPDWFHLDRAREWIVQLYEAWGKPAKAAEWKKSEIRPGGRLPST